MVTSLAAAYIC